ncbi:MAG: histidine phosphatase family protein [Ferruginibacter sp.]|nr:histidine phosphatase family protein [Ferruginibacter sp.]
MKYTILLVLLFCLPTLLKSQSLTKIFIVRHADRLEGDDLSKAGIIRAEELKRVLGRAGIQRIFSTETVRTRKTVKPLAELLHLPTGIYATPLSLINLIKTNHPGRRIVIVGHSDTVDDLISSCGCTPPQDITPNMPATQFDNLFLVALRKTVVNNQSSWVCELIHMKYGAIAN